ncbi:MAG: site-specific DNA-methyltransferase [Chloroflexi bacterium]|nr:site-specific DNA-methyltransferase [Chloroflexota bacterium]
MAKKDVRKYKIKTGVVHQGNAAILLKNKSKFPDESVDLIITSPPYADKRKKFYGSVHPSEYVDWFLPIGKELLRILKPNGSFVLNIKEHARNGERETYVIELILALKKQGWFWVEEYCWYKKNSYPGKWPNRFRDSWERCLHFTKERSFKMYQNAVKVPIGDWASKRFKSMSEKDFNRHISSTNGTLGRNVSNWLNRKKVYPHNVVVFEEEHYVSNVLEFATVCTNKNHSAVFPLELPTWFFKLFTRKGDVVLDPFIGSGTTAYAALAMGRRFIGVELNEEYVNQVNKQIELMSGVPN